VAFRFAIFVLVQFITFSFVAQLNQDITPDIRAYLFHVVRKSPILERNIGKAFEYKGPLVYLPDKTINYDSIEKILINNPQYLVIRTDEMAKCPKGVLVEVSNKTAIQEMCRQIQRYSKGEETSALPLLDQYFSIVFNTVPNEFLRGKYELDKDSYIKTLLSNMTTSEHARLVSTNFDQLWTLHWGVGRDHHSREFEISKEKFNQLNITELIEGMEAYSEPEWGFPKGRRAHRESDIECALREFSEETNILREAFVICRNIVLTETFNGTNEIAYKHIYFIALLREPDCIDLQQVMTSMQKREVSGIEWKSISECRSLTRPHYLQRNDMLDSFERIVETFDLQDNLPFKQE